MTLSGLVGRRRRIVRYHRISSFSLAFMLVSGAQVHATDLIPPKIITSTPGGINVSDGSFLYSVTDLAIGTLSFDRFQITGPKTGTLRPAKPRLGLSMTDGFDIYVTSTLAGTGRTGSPYLYKDVVHLGNAGSGSYTETTDHSYITAANKDSYAGSLSLSGGNYVYTDREGSIYTFNSAISAGIGTRSQRIASIVYGDGRIRYFNYTSAGRLKRVSDSTGYAIVMDYDGSGNVTAVCGFDAARAVVTDATSCNGAALKVNYNHDSNGSLTSVIDVLGKTTAYTDTSWGITCVQPPGYTDCKIKNDYHVSSNKSGYVTQSLYDGSTWSIITGDLTVADSPDHIPDNNCGESGQITDPNNKVTYLYFTNTSPCLIQDAKGNSTSYIFSGGQPFDYTGPVYHDGTLLSEADLPEGNKYLASYDGPYNAITQQTWKAKPGSTLPDQVLTYDYDYYQTPQSKYKPISKTDARNNQTNWLYSSYGKPLWEMQPAPVVGAARPLITYAYDQKYAWILNDSGNLVSSSNAIWLPTTETRCQTLAGSNDATCDPNAPRSVVSYEYGPDGTADNLLLRGKVVSADGKSYRTCYRYDAWSNKVAERTPRAGVSDCYNDEQIHS